MKTLRMKFQTDLGNSYILSISYCKEGITPAQAQTLMETIKNSEALNVAIAAISGAEVVDRNVTDLV